MTDLVLISLENWDQVWRRNQHLVAGLLRAGTIDRVLFVEPPIDPLHDLRIRRRPSRTRGLRRLVVDEVPGELWAYRPTKILPRRVDKHGDVRRAGKVVRVAQRLGMESPVLWINDPGGVEVLTATAWTALYDITDDWLVADRPLAETSRLREQEARLFDTCQAVVVCSESLAATKSVKREVELIPNAVDLEPYRVLAPRPPDLPKSPVALYVGTVHRDRIDVDLCIATARLLGSSTNPQERGTLTLVGPAPLPRADLEALRAAGVRLLGPKPSSQVPAYLQHADALVVPHIVSDFTDSLDPIKAYEYQAAGRRVVSTPVSGFREDTDQRVDVVRSEEFPRAVARAVASPARWSSVQLDSIPSWTERVAQMAAVIARVSQSQELP